MLIVERIAGVAGVGVQAECDQVKLIIFASNPRHLQKYESYSESKYRFVVKKFEYVFV